MLSFITLQVTPFFQNARIVYDTKSKLAVVIDPGGEVEKIIEKINFHQLSCTQIWLTHSHLDHCGGVAQLLKETGAKLFAHELDKQLRQSIELESESFELPKGSMMNCPEPDVYIKDGDLLAVGDYNFRVHHTPGHTPGHVIFQSLDQPLIISGDCVFDRHIGRGDFHGNSLEILIASIKEKILILPEETVIMCGHGPDTSVRREINENPYLR